MKPIIPFFLLVLFSAGVFAQVGTLTVTVLSSETGSGLTEIEYEFTGDDEVYNISAEVSFDNGGTFDDIPGAHLEGALTNVAPGGPYSLTWDGIASFPETFSDETIIKIGATSTTFTCGDDNNLTFTYDGSEVTYGTVPVDYEGAVGERCWLDRNLGAEDITTFDIATAIVNDDERLYGDLFQWGRGDDGHQVRDPLSTTTSTLSATDDPGHGSFIKVGDIPYDWRSSQNNDLWQGVNGINNPCPPGWRVPTEDELTAELDSWGHSDNSDGAFASPLKLPVAGRRSRSDGSLDLVGSIGYYWSSAGSGTSSRRLGFSILGAGMGYGHRAFGYSVRCIKDD